jgi:hypothetical protein
MIRVRRVREMTHGWRNSIKDCIDMLNRTTCTMLDDITQRHNSMYDDKIIYVTVATHGHSTSVSMLRVQASRKERPMVHA